MGLVQNILCSESQILNFEDALPKFLQEFLKKNQQG